MDTRGFLAVLLLATAADAQVGELWAEHYDSPLGPSDKGYDVAFDASGRVYVTGISYGTNHAPLDRLTLAYGADGTLLWDRRYNAYGHWDIGVDVEVDPADGSVYSFGRSHGNLPGGISIEDASLIKYDASGNLLWARAYDGPAMGPDQGQAIAIDVAGDVVGVGAATAGSSSDPLIARWDAAGNVEWAAVIPTLGGDYLNAVVIAPSGDIYAAGITGGSTFLGDVYVVKLSATGTVLWQRSFDGGGAPVTGSEIAYGIALAPSGGVYVSGDAITPGGADAVLLSYDAAGNLLWSRTIDGAGHANDSGSECGVDGAGDVYLAGRVNEGAATKHDFLLAKFDAAGNELWRRTWDGPAHQDDAGLFLAVEPGGGATVAGHSTGATGAGDSDVSVVRWDAAGNLAWQHVASTPGILEDRTYALARGPGGVLAVTGSSGTTSTGAVWTIVLVESAERFCFGDGAAASCPCGNDSPAGLGRGCANSIGSSAQLVDGGVASVSNDTLALTSSGELPNALSIFLQGDAQVAFAPFGDGLRCVGGSLRRLYVTNASGGVASAPPAGEPGVSQRSAALGDPLAPGSRRFLQTYYRDPDLAFCPAPAGDGWNASSGLIVDWAP